MFPVGKTKKKLNKREIYSYPQFNDCLYKSVHVRVCVCDTCLDTL